MGRKRVFPGIFPSSREPDPGRLLRHQAPQSRERASAGDSRGATSSSTGEVGEGRSLDGQLVTVIDAEKSLFNRFTAIDVRTRSRESRRSGR
jgi:hypothetical protein